MIVRKLTFAPDEAGPQPTAEIVRDFLMSLGSLRVEASLDKQKYFHGESIVVNVLVDNNSTKTVKKIKLLVRQYTVICLPNASHYKCNVAEINSEEGFPIWPSQTGWCKVYRLCPLLADNRDKSGLALDGDLKNEDTNLASSTIVPPNSSREAVGIVVQYKVKIRLILGFGLSDVCLELPFILTHPNPEPNPALVEGESGIPTDNLLDDFHFTEAGRPGDDSSGGEGGGGGGVVVSVPPTPVSIPLQPLSNGGPSASATVSISAASTAVAATAAASKPQMGLLAKRAAAINVNGSGSGMNGERKSPPHIAEFLRASEMPDGMAAFALSPPQPQQRSVIVDGGGAMAMSRETVDALANGRCVQSSLSSSASPALMSSAMAISAIQQPSTSNALVPRNLTPISTVSPQKSQILDADDLIFEDFARLRLMEQQQKQQQQ
ncbi:unnamed protein product [Hymenolepis diminuta]|uniref:Arrestin_C domain-containing protein n=1 Tax=Hymenolepis diminuta TaxID=6216 RepID=A0A158QD69_HYMDI|nr:unnamed protein product [Hymenolepis diminuta]